LAGFSIKSRSYCWVCWPWFGRFPCPLPLFLLRTCHFERLESVRNSIHGFVRRVYCIAFNLLCNFAWDEESPSRRRFHSQSFTVDIRRSELNAVFSENAPSENCKPYHSADLVH
jgi:hypothetical protein